MELAEKLNPLSLYTDWIPAIGPWSEYRRELNKLGLCLLFSVGLIGGFTDVWFTFKLLDREYGGS